MKYVDSNIFIFPIIYDGKAIPKAKAAEDVLIKIAEGDLSAATSFLTWDELVWIIRKSMNEKIATKEGEKFLRFSNLEMLEITESIVKKAQKIVEEYGIRPRDALHVASAIENGIKEIISDDSDLDKVKEIKKISI